MLRKNLENKRYHPPVPPASWWVVFWCFCVTSVTTPIKACLLVGFFFVGSYGRAQNLKQTDSLILVYHSGNLTKQERYVVLRGLAEGAPQPEKRLQFANELIALALEDTSHLWLYRGYMQKGSALRQQGNLEEAIAAYFASAVAAKKIDYKAGIGGVLLSIGAIYSNNNDHQKGIRYKKEAIEVLRTADDSVTLATAILNTGYAYYLIDAYDSALAYYQESADIFEIKNHLIGKAYNLGNAGLVYAKQGEIGQAEKQLTEAIAILSNLEDSYAITEFQIEMGRIYQQRNEYQRAEKYLTAALGFAVQDGLQERIRDASFQLSELYNKVRDYQKAYKFQRQYIAYRDSINNEETIRKIADLRTEYEVAKKQTEVDLLNIASEKQQILLISLAVVISLMMVLGYVLYKAYAMRTRSNNLLASRRKVIVQQRDELDALNRTKDRFFSIISHDLRGPVSNFQGVSQLIRILVEADDTHELLRLSDLLDKSTRELSSLLDNLLHWALSQQGKFPYQPEKIDLAETCQATTDVMENIANVKNIRLIKQIDQRIIVWADQNSTLTIVRNLVGNALKFTPEDGSVTLSIRREQNMGIVEVADTGVGIAPDKMENLFGFEGKRSKWGTAGEKGVGLGLTLTKEFIEMNHGKITVTSEEAKGSVFTVYLPLFTDQT